VRILLVNPSSRGILGSLGFVFPPLGVLYVAAAVRSRGYTVEVVDQCVDDRKIDLAGFDVVGIHSNTIQANIAMNLARQASALGAKVVMGGPHPCFVAEEILATGVVDAIVDGEGERSFPDLLDAWRDGTDPAATPGLILSTAQGMVNTGPSERIHDLDNLPLPARDLLDSSRYAQTRLGDRRMTSMHTSRGCPHRCRFCSSSQFDGLSWRPRSAEGVLAELEHVVNELGYGAVAFMDDNFTHNIERVEKICAGIMERGLDVHWRCLARVDTIARHPEMIERMGAAGLRSVFIGVETPRPEVLDSLHKGIDSDQAREAVQILKRNGIESYAGHILGAPEDGRADVRASIRFARELDTNAAQFTILTPYPGTDLYKKLEGAITVKNWDKFDGFHAVYKHPRISRIELQLWVLWGAMSFYFRHRKAIRDFFRFLWRIWRPGRCSHQPAQSVGK